VVNQMPRVAQRPLPTRSTINTDRHGPRAHASRSSASGGGSGGGTAAARKLQQRRADVIALNSCLARRSARQFGSRLVVVGGSNVYGQSHSVWEFQPHACVWRRMRPTLQPRCNAAVCAGPSAGELVCCGGYATGGTYLDSVEVHRSGTEPTLLPPMPTGVYGARACCTGNELVVVGGQSCESIKARDDVFRYSFETKRWTAAPKLCSGPRRFPGVCPLPEGGVLVCGGQSLSGEALRSVERWDPREKLWLTLPPMRSARYSHSCCVMPDGRVGVFGSQCRSRSCEVLDLSRVDDGWALLPSLNVGRAHTCAAAVGLSVYVVGGTRDAGVPDEVLHFSPSQSKATNADVQGCPKPLEITAKWSTITISSFDQGTVQADGKDRATPGVPTPLRECSAVSLCYVEQ
jgi:hypothetical protein